jgi:predicted transcriptional regulator
MGFFACYLGSIRIQAIAEDLFLPSRSLRLSLRVNEIASRIKPRRLGLHAEEMTD